MQHGREAYLPLSAGKDADKAAEAVLEYFRDRETREEFYKYFRELQKEVVARANEVLTLLRRAAQ